MDPRFQAFIEAAVERAKADSNLLWADDLAHKIASSTPLHVEASALAEQLTHEAARAGVAVTVARGHRRSRTAVLRAAAA